MLVVRCGASKRDWVVEGRQMSVPGGVVRVKWAVSTVVVEVLASPEGEVVVWVKVWEGMVGWFVRGCWVSCCTGDAAIRSFMPWRYGEEIAVEVTLPFGSYLTYTVCSQSLIASAKLSAMLS